MVAWISPTTVLRAMARTACAISAPPGRWRAQPARADRVENTIADAQITGSRAHLILGNAHGAHDIRRSMLMVSVRLRREDFPLVSCYAIIIPASTPALSGSADDNLNLSRFKDTDARRRIASYFAGLELRCDGRAFACSVAGVGFRSRFGRPAS